MTAFVVLKTVQSVAPPKKIGKLEIFLRLTRAQFVPLIILPSAVGTAYAFRSTNSFNLGYFALVIVGVVLLHLGANAIDDCYDYQNGVDGIANSNFPKDFGGWKPLPRGLLSLRDAKIISYLLFLGSLLISVYFSIVVGYWSLIFAVSGILLAVAYTAPPMKLDYSGKGLGEIAILLAFGPIPVLGSFYVQTGMLNLSAFLISIAVGIMTVTILIDHDMIFYEVYVKARKFSLAAVLGRSKALSTSLYFTLVAYGFVIALIAVRALPVSSAVAPITSALVLSRKFGTFGKPNEPPPFYVPFTENALISDWLFSLVLAVSIAIPLH
jgi:1,4-dihydroxy-2-naphthoate polyprenyltransferase